MPYQPPQTTAEARRERLRAESELGRLSLRKFIRMAWPVVEPATPFIDGWVVGALSEHLEAVSRLQIRNLIINIPPRSCKSLTVSVFWPVWTWISFPATRLMYASYALSLSIRDSVKCRRIIESPWFQERWGDRFQLTGDQNRKDKFENDKTGYRIATSVGGSITGEGGSILAADDPHNVAEGESDAVRNATLDWWDTVMTTRGNDPKTVRKVIVMQRIHERDLTGHLLSKEGSTWEHLCLPAEYECPRAVATMPGQPDAAPAKPMTSIGWSDPRAVEGELLWPERFGRPEIDELKRELGTYATASQLQQHPAPLAGGIVKKAWFRYWKRDQEDRIAFGDDQTRLTPWHLFRFATVDFAVSLRDQADFTVCAVWGVARDGSRRMALLDLLRRKMEGPDIVPAVKAFAVDKWKVFHLWPEPAGFQLAIVQEMIRKGLPVRQMPREWLDRDKMTRLLAATPALEQGMVWFPKYAPWIGAFEQELLTFPNAAHDDQVDVLAYAVAAWSRTPLWGANDSPLITLQEEEEDPPDSIAAMTRRDRDPWRNFMGQTAAEESPFLGDEGRIGSGRNWN